jgi:hypothetical protein
MNVNKNARTAGILYLLLIPFSVFGMIYVPDLLVEPGSVAETVQNIAANETLFRLGIVSALIVQVLNIFVVLALYRLLKPANKNMAVLMVVFSLVAVPIAMLSELNHFAVLLISSGAEPVMGLSADQLQGLVPLFLDLHEQGINIASIFWGLWLFPMGYLVFKSGYLPRILGILLMIGCFGYLIDSFAAFLIPAAGVNVAMFTFVGEILFPLWLLVKGVNVEKWNKQALEPAKI